MKPDYFIYKKIRSGEVSGKRFAGPVLKVAVAGIVLGMTVMILSLAIGSGFKKEIRDKIVGFGSHIQVTNYDYNQSYESIPFLNDSALLEKLLSVNGVKKVQTTATKPGLFKTENEIQGIVIKGVGQDYDFNFLQNILVEGNIPQYSSDSTSNDILISDDIASMLNLKVGETVMTYFFQEQIRVRRFNVVGIFDSQIPDLDKLFVIGDIRHIQRLNNWEYNQIAGYDILIDDYEQMNEVAYNIFEITAMHVFDDGTMLRTQTIRQTQPMIFGWLDLLDMNIVVIIVLILLVAGFNMISGLLILILERTNMIGILKSVGTSNWTLRKIFLRLSTEIVLRGIIMGNLLGIAICIIQSKFGIISLDPTNYFIETVPIFVNPLHLVLLNIGSIFAIFLLMLGPSYLAARISPIKSIMFD
ncbi:MAG: ABC transporter permease [Marinilabiliaceae bacterium]|nr:ABC transporter permease [Marinilabiliaceae bacterium]